MASVRDPGTAAMQAAETARARESVRQSKAQHRARRAREKKLGGSREARVELAQDYAAVNPVERRRAGQTDNP